MDLIHRRRAIYTGMRAYFDDHELYQAISLWQKDYSEKPKYALSVFVARCCSTPELKEQRAKILGSIFNAMDMPIEQLLADPIDAMKAESSLPPAAQHVQDGKTQVFIHLFEQMLSKVNDHDERNIRQFVIDQSAKLEMDERRSMHLKQWLAKRRPILAANYSLPIMQKIIHYSYVAMCEQIGPVKSDQSLAQAIKETEPLAETLHFKLHDLL